MVGCSESGGGDRQDRWSSPPQRGNTVYVHGHGVSEKILQRAFAKIGGIVNISMDTDRKLVLELILQQYSYSSIPLSILWHITAGILT